MTASAICILLAFSEPCPALNVQTPGEREWCSTAYTYEDAASARGILDNASRACPATVVSRWAEAVPQMGAKP